MARLVKQMPASGYFQRAGRATSQYGLRVPETGFFGREFDVQDLGRMVRAGQGIYNLAEDVTEGLVKPVAKKLDQMSEERRLKKAKAKMKAEAAKKMQQKEEVEKKLKERARLDAELERDIQGMQDVPDVSQAVSDIEQRKRAIDAQSEELEGLKGEFEVETALDPRFLPLEVPRNLEVSPFSGLVRTQRGASRDAVYDPEKGSRRALQQNVSAVELGQRQFPRSPLEQNVSAAMPGGLGQRQLSVDMPGQVAMPAADAQQAERALVNQAVQQMVRRQSGGSTSPTATPVTPLQARTAAAPMRPAQQARSFADADAAAQRFLEQQVGMKPGAAADYMTVQQAKRTIPAPRVPRFYREMLDLDPADAAEVMSLTDVYSLARGATQADWPKISEIAREVIGRDSSYLFDTIPYATELDKVYKLIPKPGAQKGVSIDLASAASMRKNLADARLKESKADRKERWQRVTRNVPNKGSYDKYAEFMADVSVSGQGDEGAIEVVVPMTRDRLMASTMPVPGHGTKTFSDLTKSEQRKFVGELQAASVVIANVRKVRIGSGGNKTRKVKSVNDIISLIRKDQPMPIPTPERGISKAKYRAAQKAVNRIKARIKKAEKQIAALTVTIPDPIVFDKDNIRQVQKRDKEIQAAQEKQKRNEGQIGRLQTQINRLEDQLEKQNQTVNEYEEQDGK